MQPDITGLCPTQLKDHLRMAIVMGSHSGGVLFTVKCGTANVCHSDAGVLHWLLLTALVLFARASNLEFTNKLQVL